MFRYLIAALALTAALIAAPAHAQSIAELTGGRPYTVFHGEFSSADATDATLTTEAQHRLALYQDRSTTAITLAATDVVVILDIQFAALATTTLLNFYDGADNTIDAGESILKNTRTLYGTAQFPRGYFCQPGTYPKMKAGAAGQVDATVRGIIIKNP